jgi:hypothetical protein
MRLQSALSLSILRSSLLVALLSAFPVSQAKAVPIQMTSGSIRLTVTSPAPFVDVFVNLQGAGFSLSNDLGFLTDFFKLTGIPEPVFVPPGTMVDFMGRATLVAPDDLLVYGGDSYRASGFIDVSTSSLVVGPLLTLPFTLSGSIHGESLTGPGMVDLDIIGGGTVTATYTGEFPPQITMWSLESVVYQVEPIVREAPIPEPATFMLIGAGLLGFAARRWSSRHNG